MSESFLYLRHACLEGIDVTSGYSADLPEGEIFIKAKEGQVSLKNFSRDSVPALIFSQAVFPVFLSILIFYPLFPARYAAGILLYTNEF